jgi:hypothetical protein
MSALTHLFCAPPSEPVAEPVSEAKGFSLGYIPSRKPSLSTKLKTKAKPKAKKVKAKPKQKHRAISFVDQWVMDHGEFNEAEFKKAFYDYKLAMKQTPTSFLAAAKAYDFKLPKQWMILRGAPPNMHDYLNTLGKTFIEIYIKLIKQKRSQSNFFYRWKTYNKDLLPIPLLNSYMQLAMKNERARQAFCAVARAWKRSKLELKNTEDLMTGEAPIIPIKLVDWATRSTYSFEAKTIARDIITRLTLSHCDFFPWPKQPRNPYTNNLLTEGQFYSVARQLRAAGETHWAIEGLYSAKYNIKEYERDMYTKIKRHIHNSIFANPTGETAKEVLLDYIQEEHEAHKMDYEKDIYEWAMENCAHHNKIHEWRVQCAKHYTVQHFPGEEKADALEKERIDTATKRLCVSPLALIHRYDEAHEKKYVRLADRVVDEAEVEIVHIIAISSALFSSSDDETASYTD